MPKVGHRPWMRLAQFLEKEIETVPVVFKFVVIPTKMTELEKFQQGRIVFV